MEITPQEASCLALLSSLIVEGKLERVEEYLKRFEGKKSYKLAAAIISISKSGNKPVTDDEKLAQGYIEWARIDKSSYEHLNMRTDK